MVEFNHLQEAIDKSIKFGRRQEYVVLGFKGDPEKYSSNSYRVPDPSRPPYGRMDVAYKSVSERKSESSKMIQAEVLILEMGSNYVGWKSLYKNTKGIYFNKHSRKYYI